MAIDLDDEIVQDFLIEAGEILETLNEQLVDLESQPDDMDMLNSVFRSFHTIKGGAGFLAIEALVDVCHKAENIFDLLRNGQRRVDSQLMDVVLEVLDVVNDMFQSISHGEDPTPAREELLQSLEALSCPADSAEAAVADAAENNSTGEPVDETTADKPQSDDITDDEFEALLDELQGDKKPAAQNKSKPTSDLITDDEFEELLDELQGKQTEKNPATEQADAAPQANKSGDDISEEEFEQLLDDIQAGKVSTNTIANQPAAKAAHAKPESKADEKPASPASNVTPLKPPAEKKAPAAKPATAKADTTVRVETSVLDRIMNMVGELVLLRNRLSTIESSINNEEVTETVSNLDVVTSDLQTSVMKTRMQPIKKVFGRFPRVVRDLARSLNKEVALEMIGEDTDLDKNLVEALADPLIHLVRNSVDHGVEMPDEREAAGKTRCGTIVLSATQEGDHILLMIEDDGKGMDHNVLRKKAIEKGLMDEDTAARLDDVECYNLIFMPGFSTKEEISDVSGRGVGMDVVKTRINQLNGTVSINSQLGKGTTISIKVPLTLAIMPTLMVQLGQQHQTFALPLVSVKEIIDYDMNKVNVVDGQKVVIVRGKALPLFYLSNWLAKGGATAADDNGHVVIVSIGTHMIALLVDRLMGREEVVIKPLGALLQGTKGLAGATITGNGKIALILDLPDLLQSYANHY